MREILFRAKRLDNGEWVQGVFVPDYTQTAFYITKIGEFCYKINPNTVGQFTGLIDKNGTKIFEGDIVRTDREFHHSENKIERDIFTSVVKYSDKDCSFGLNGKYKHLTLLRFKGDFNFVIGNIHDNPELIGGADNEL